MGRSQQYAAPRLVPLEHRILIRLGGGGKHEVEGLGALAEDVKEAQRADRVIEAVKLLLGRGLVRMPGGKEDAPTGQDVVCLAPLAEADPGFDLEPRLDVLPAAGGDEDLALVRQLVLDGCRDPLLLCRLPGRERPVLLDGRRRLTVCRRHGLEYQTREVEMASLPAAQAWLWEHHYATRNYTGLAMAYARGRAYLGRRGQRGGAQQAKSHSETSEDDRAAEWVAARYGSSRATVMRDRDLALALDRVAAAAGAGVTRDLLSRRVRVTRDDVRLLAAPEREGIVRLVGQLLGGDRSGLDQARQAEREAKRRAREEAARKGGGKNDEVVKPNERADAEPAALPASPLRELAAGLFGEDGGVNPQVATEILSRDEVLPLAEEAIMRRRGRSSDPANDTFYRADSAWLTREAVAERAGAWRERGPGHEVEIDGRTGTLTVRTPAEGTREFPGWTFRIDGRATTLWPVGELLPPAAPPLELREGA